jgi:MFS family permease
MNAPARQTRGWVVAAMLFALTAINFIDKVALGLVAGPLMKSLHLSPAQYGVLAGSFFFLFGIAGIAGGFLANRVATRWLLLGMAVLWALVQLPIAFSSSLVTLIACRVLLGASEGPAQPISIHACYKWFPDAHRNLPVSVLQQGGVFGMIAAGMVIPLINEAWGWRSNFKLLAVLGLAWALLWLIVGHEGPLDVRSRQDVAMDTPDGIAPMTARSRVSYRTLLTDRTIVSIIGLHFAAFLTLALVLTWLPVYLSQGLGYPAQLAGRIFAGMLLVSTPVGLLLSGWSQRMMLRGVPSRVARGTFVSACLTLGGLLFAIVPIFSTMPAVKVALIALAISTTPIIYSLGPAMVSQIVPPAQRGGAIAIEYSVAWTAGIIAPPAVGWLIRAAGGDVTTGFERGLVFAGLLLVVLGIAALKVTNPERSLERLADSAAA